MAWWIMFHTYVLFIRPAHSTNLEKERESGFFGQVGSTFGLGSTQPIRIGQDTHPRL